MMEKFENLERVVISELEKLNNDYANKNEFTEADAKKFDMLAHAWKSLETAVAMCESDDRMDGGMSGRMYGRNRYGYRSGKYMPGPWMQDYDPREWR